MWLAVLLSRALSWSANTIRSRTLIMDVNRVSLAPRPAPARHKSYDSGNPLPMTFLPQDGLRKLVTSSSPNPGHFAGIFDLGKPEKQGS
jgi:hypothetical protein